MKEEVRILPAISWISGIAVFVIGVMNLLQVGPIPGMNYLLLLLAYDFPGNAFF